MLFKGNENAFEYFGGVICTIYLFIGNSVNKQQLVNRIYQLPVYIKILAMLLWLIVAAFCPGLDIGFGSLGFSIVGFIVSFIGTFYVLGFCKRFKLKFRWIGRNTLYVLCAHILLWRILDVFGFSSKDLPFNAQINFIVEVCYETVGALVLAWLLSKTRILEYKK